MWMSGEVTSIPSLTRSGRPELQLRLEPALGKDVDGVPREVGEAPPELHYRALWRCFGKGTARAKRRRIRKLRLLALLAVLGAARASRRSPSAAARRSRRRSRSSTRRPAARRRQNTYVYASDGHTVLAILRGSQARVVVPSQAHLAAGSSTRSSRSRTSASTSTAASTCAASCAPSGPTSPTRARSRAARRSPSSSSRTRSTATRRRSTRKLKEAALAWKLEQVWTKDQILTAYLNTIYFGNGAYGVQEACRVYFGHSATHVEPGRGGAARRHPARTRASTTRSRTRGSRATGATSCSSRCTSQDYLDRRPVPTRRSGRRCRTRQTCSLPSTQSAAAPYFANYVTDQLVRQYGAAAGLRRRAEGDDDDRPRPAEASRARRSTRCCRRRSGRPRRSSRSTSTPATCSRWSAAATTTRASSTSRPRASASRARRSSRSCSRRRCRTGSRRRRRSSRTRSRSTPAAGSGASTTSSTRPRPDRPLEGDRVLRQHRLRAADEHRRPDERRARPRRTWGSRRRSSPYFSIGLGAEPATPLEMARAYATLADGGYRLDGSIFGNEPRAIESIVDANGKPSTTERR